VIEWIHGLPVVWLIVVVFAGTLLVTACIYAIVMRLAVGDSAAAFKGVSPGLLPPLGLIFGLVVGFLVADLWRDVSEARTAVNHEASALRSAALVMRESFPGRPEDRMEALIRQHIRSAVAQEWPEMSRRDARLSVVPEALAEALRLAFALDPHSEGQVTAQRELVTSLQDALDARRQRIIISESTVNWVRWMALIALAALTLLAIAFVHCDNRRTAAIAMGIFASAVAVTLVLIASQDRPFGSEFGVEPDVLREVLPRGG
jgi:hypothetical protein